jgi:hypothetical protein
MICLIWQGYGMKVEMDVEEETGYIIRSPDLSYIDIDIDIDR